MTLTSEPSPHAVATSEVATAARPVPRRADGLELLGEMEQSGFREPPCLVCRSDGQVIQLTDLLYRTLEAVDGSRSLDEVAAEVSRSVGKEATADDVSFLLEEKLRPLGLLTGDDGSQPDLVKANPLLALRFRVVASNPALTQRITAPFAKLFFPPIVVAVVAGFVAMTGWLLFEHGLARSTRDLFYSPGLIVVLFVLTAVSAGWHEFGHAAACRYGGARPGAMGAGLYLVWPAFYTDVTDSYRLDRRGRLRTDLGGLYFNMIFALATFGAWKLTGWDALLLLIPVQLFAMMHQLLPFVRLDGYHILADTTGVPDLFARIKPTLSSALPGHHDERASALKPWVRVVVTVWVLLVVPLLFVSLLMAAFALPRMVATAWDSASIRAAFLADAWQAADYLNVVATVLTLAFLALPVLSIVYMLTRLASRVVGAGWARVSPSPVGRTMYVAAVGGVAAVLAFLWWPNGEYRPIQRRERGTVLAGVRSVRHLESGRPGLTPARQEELRGAPFHDETPSTTTTSTSTTTTTTTVERPADGEPAPTTTTEPSRPSATTEPRRPSTTTTDAPATTTSTAPTTTTTASAAPTTTTVP